MNKKLVILLAMLNFTILSDVAFADEEAKKDIVEYKLTLSHYSTESTKANDINLRASKSNQTFWLGYYAENTSNVTQLRAGYERTDQLPYTHFISSLQIAEHGFLGWSENAEIGAPFFVLAGIGRTNLRPYNNINFDPNDAITYGVGWRNAEDTSISLYAVKDDRVNKGQQIAHLVFRQSLEHTQRLTLDIFNKTGPSDAMGESINATGSAITYDVSRYSLRFAYEPKVNFSQESMLRLSAAFRF